MIKFFQFLKRSATSAINFFIQLKHNTILERHFRTKLKRNLTFAIKISQHNVFCNFKVKKRVNNLLKKVEIYQCYNRNGTKLSSTYEIALLIKKKKKIESAA